MPHGDPVCKSGARGDRPPAEPGPQPSDRRDPNSLIIRISSRLGVRAIREKTGPYCRNNVALYTHAAHPQLPRPPPRLPQTHPPDRRRRPWPLRPHLPAHQPAPAGPLPPSRPLRAPHGDRVHHLQCHHLLPHGRPFRRRATTHQLRPVAHPHRQLPVPSARPARRREPRDCRLRHALPQARPGHRHQ